MCLDLGLYPREGDFGSVCAFPYILLWVIWSKIVWYMLRTFGLIPLHECGAEILMKPECVKPLGDAKHEAAVSSAGTCSPHGWWILLFQLWLRMWLLEYWQLFFTDSSPWCYWIYFLLVWTINHPDYFLIYIFFHHSIIITKCHRKKKQWQYKSFFLLRCPGIDLQL